MKTNPYEDTLQSVKSFSEESSQDPKRQIQSQESCDGSESTAMTHRKEPYEERKTESHFKPTVGQLREVEKAQNANRCGPGRKKQNRKPIRFDAELDSVERVLELHYIYGRSKNDLYNEALKLLIEKYER